MHRRGSFSPRGQSSVSAERYKNEFADRLFRDDDRIYFPNWVEGFMQTRTKRLDDAIVTARLQFDGLTLPQAAGLKPPSALAAIRAGDFRWHVGRVLKSVQDGGLARFRSRKNPLSRNSAGPVIWRLAKAAAESWSSRGSLTKAYEIFHRFYGPPMMSVFRVICIGRKLASERWQEGRDTDQARWKLRMRGINP